MLLLNKRLPFFILFEINLWLRAETKPGGFCCFAGGETAASSQNKEKSRKTTTEAWESYRSIRPHRSVSGSLIQHRRFALNSVFKNEKFHCRDQNPIRDFFFLGWDGWDAPRWLCDAREGGRR